MNLDLEELAAVIEQLDKTEFTDFRFESGELRIHVRRGGHDGPVEPFGAASVGQPANESAAQPAPAAAPPTPDPAAAQSAPASEPAASPATPGPGSGLDPENLPDGYTAVTAPMLGIFYSAPKPGAAPFVAVGDSVGPDSTLCIIEVMKLMNSVTAGLSGEVAAVFLQAGDLAEFGQPLFAVRAAA